MVSTPWRLMELASDLLLFISSSECSYKGQDTKVSSDVQTLCSYLCRQCMANNWPHLHIFIDLWATANGMTVYSGQVKQFLSKLVSFSVKNSWNLLPPERSYPKCKSGSHISPYIKATIQCLTMALLFLFGVLHTYRNSVILLLRIQNSSSWTRYSMEHSSPLLVSHSRCHNGFHKQAEIKLTKQCFSYQTNIMGKL